MFRSLAFAAAFSSAIAISASASAQTLIEVVSRDVVGNWTVMFTPSAGGGADVRVESSSGGRPELPLTISAQPDGALACHVQARSAPCEIKDGELVISAPSRSGEGTMVFTFSTVTDLGLSGTALARVNGMPGDIPVGSVLMKRT